MIRRMSPFLSRISDLRDGTHSILGLVRSWPVRARCLVVRRDVVLDRHRKRDAVLPRLLERARGLQAGGGGRGCGGDLSHPQPRRRQGSHRNHRPGSELHVVPSHDYRLPAFARPAGYGGQAAYRQPPAAYCLLPTASCQLPAASCLLPTAYCQLPAASCQLPAASCQLPYTLYHESGTALRLSPRDRAPLVCATSAPLPAQAPSQPVSWSIALAPPGHRVGEPGGRLSVAVTARIAEGWHIYGTDELKVGPRPLGITLAAGQPFKPAGKLQAPSRTASSTTRSTRSRRCTPRRRPSACRRPC